MRLDSAVLQERVVGSEVCTGSGSGYNAGGLGFLDAESVKVSYRPAMPTMTDNFEGSSSQAIGHHSVDN